MTSSTKGRAGVEHSSTTRKLMVLVVLVLLVGCGHPEGQRATTTASTSARTWDPQAWRSPVTPTPIVLTAAEQQSRREANLKSYVAQLQVPADKPPALVRWNYPEEMGVVWTDCLVKDGWTNSYASPEGGIGWSDPPKSQESVFKKAVWRCAAQYSIDPRLAAEATPDMLTISWYYLRDYAIPCVKAHGYAPDGPLPTQETFISTGGDFLLYPGGVHPMPDVVRRECPQGPPSKAMLGD